MKKLEKVAFSHFFDIFNDPRSDEDRYYYTGITGMSFFAFSSIPL